MYKLCKTEQSALRQRQLEEGLMEAMLVQNYEDISISDLCDQLGVPRKSFYRYFASKDGALHALIDHRFLDYELKRAGAIQDKRADMDQLIWFYVYWKSQKKLLDALARSKLSSLLAERAMASSEASNVFDFQTKKVPKNFHALANSFVVSGLITLVIQWHHDGFQESAENMAKMTRILLTQPLVPDK